MGHSYECGKRLAAHCPLLLLVWVYATGIRYVSRQWPPPGLVLTAFEITGRLNGQSVDRTAPNTRELSI